MTTDPAAPTDVPESVRETVFWSAQPEIHESIAEARAARAEGRTTSAAGVWVAFGLDR